MTRPGSHAVFRRERLLRELIQNSGVACTWIVGPPGSGKTALMGSFADERPNHLWYRVDADDGDPSAFFAHLTAAVQHASIGEVAQGLPRFGSDSALSVLSFARLYFRRLYSLAPHLLIALDDYHEARVDCPLHEILRLAIEHAPPGVHIAVTSRSRPPAALARCQTNGLVRAMSWDQLMLTPDEVTGIAGLHGIALDRHASDEWHRRCGGWAAGLRLLLQAGATLPADVVHPDSQALLFDYLGEEVFRAIPSATQSLLLRLAFLTSIPADALIELAGLPAAERQLASMAEENLLTTVSHTSPRSYRFHPLFRDFLVHRAKGHLPKEEIATIRNRSAAVLEARGLVAEAAQILIEAESWDHLSRLVLSHAPMLASQSRHTTLEHWLSALPYRHVDGDPWLLYWSGLCRSLQDPAAARTSFQAAFDQFTVRQDRTGQLLAWSGVVDCIFRIYANLRQLDEWIARLDGLLAADAPFPSPEVEARVTFSIFVALSFRQPQSPNLAMWRQRLDAMADFVPDPIFRMLSRMHLTVDQIWQGQMQDAGAELEKLRRTTAQLPTSPFVDLVLHFAFATVALHVGDVQPCFDAIEKALALAEDSGIHIWDKILLGQGAALALGHGDLERAQRFAQRRNLIASPADDEEQALHHCIEAWSSWLRAAPADALAHVRMGSQFNQRMGLPHFNAIGHLSTCIVSFECGDPESGLSQLQAGRALGKLTGNPMLGWMADLLEAYMHLRRGEDAVALIESFANVGSKQGYCHFFFWPRDAVAVVCFKALELGIQPEYVKTLIERGRLAPPPEAMQSDCWPWPVKIFTLGRFSVLVDGSPIEFKGKAQRAPMNLLKALIAFGGVNVAESRIIDSLWPDSDGTAGEQALATTLFRLRKLIGANVIKRQDGHLAIVASECWIDCWALQRLLSTPGKQPDSFVEQVKRLYVGPFLRSEPDASWALQLSERLHVALVKKLLTTAGNALAQGLVQMALTVYGAGIEIDDLVEDFYRGQIQCHAARDQLSDVVLSYRRCQRTLQNRLGVEPSQTTTRLYLSAIHKSKSEE